MRQPHPHATSGPARPAHFTVVGNPGSRRVALFRAAARAAGCPEPVVVAWRDVLCGEYILAEGTLLRIDSPGEDDEVDQLLRGSAFGPDWAPARAEGSAAWYRGFTAALRSIAGTAAATPGCTVLGDVDEIAAMFDKRRAHTLLDTAGVPVPPALDQGTRPVAGWEDLRTRLAASGLRRVFVKPAHGSSGSGVAALVLGPLGRASATTSAELVRTADGQVRLFNSLRVRRYTDESDLCALFDALAADPLHVERWLPKATQQGRPADLRVLVTAGRATHAVLRTSRHPMTNLHLGGQRGDLDLVRDIAGPGWRRLIDTAEQAAGCFPRSLSIGVDVLPAIGWRSHAVGEVNAFGDLLPRLPGLPGSAAEGQDTYSAFVTAALNTTGAAAATQGTLP
ncbi:STM4014 family protein [Streptacidiphilus sp. EB129]|uniref:STM4014 family protein n=1 Tax=Streptacidiphilus sp. EB129 TaxID=3156262 RepID=UPI003512E57D